MKDFIEATYNLFQIQQKRIEELEDIVKCQWLNPIRTLIFCIKSNTPPASPTRSHPPELKNHKTRNNSVKYNIIVIIIIC